MHPFDPATCLGSERSRLKRMDASWSLVDASADTNGDTDRIPMCKIVLRHSHCVTLSLVLRYTSLLVQCTGRSTGHKNVNRVVLAERLLAANKKKPTLLSWRLSRGAFNQRHHTKILGVRFTSSLINIISAPSLSFYPALPYCPSLVVTLVSFASSPAPRAAEGSSVCFCSIVCFCLTTPLPRRPG